jgi:hypothetical protein
MPAVIDITLDIVSGHQLEDMQEVSSPGTQSFAYSIDLKKQFF